MRKPETLLYGVDDLPPARVAFIAALQQVAFLVTLLGVPGVAAMRLGLTPQGFFDLSATTLFCAGIALILQGYARFGVGAGLFYPLQCTTAAIPALAYAGSSGLSLGQSFTMVAVVGLSQLVCSFVLVRLRGIITVEAAGLAVFLIGVGLGQQGLVLIFDAPPGFNDAMAHIAIAFLTLTTLIVLHIYVRNRVRLFTNLIGLTVGLVVTAAVGLLDPHEIDLLAAAPWISFPLPPLFGWDFQAGAIIPFAVTGFVFALTSVGVQTIAQRNNDRDFKAPDLTSISRGIRAEGLVHLLAGLINALPMVASGGAVALAAASGCTARRLAFWTGGLLILFSFLPKMIGFWILLPSAATGALFLFLATFTTVNGLQLVASRVLDARKVVAIGMGFVTAIAYEPLHNLLEGRIPELRLVTFSSFAVSILVTIVLLALFRIGARRSVVRRFPGGEASHNEVADFIEAEAGRWGAPVDVVQRGAHVAWQAIELIGREFVDPARPAIEVTTGFNDIVFDVIVRYEGTALVPPAGPPSAEDLVDNPDLVHALSAYLISRLAPDFRTQRAGSMWELHFRLPV
ncbi:solute carrier family 23 protein [Aquabacter spiritensis]|uniref:Xanthine/uracil permease n=1 Tax=Aquabacter spiritensis TaxID=933073 RepID=A0A4R3LXE6_9HYPH|nr:solute carrier family 23 protein [Aquabacter spiritensis]TCT03257.1 xanthine/uracil permease [Aquabacter spiritensis]